MLETHAVNRLVINTVLFMLNKRILTVNFQHGDLCANHVWTFARSEYCCSDVFRCVCSIAMFRMLNWDMDW